MRQKTFYEYYLQTSVWYLNSPDFMVATCSFFYLKCQQPTGYHFLFFRTCITFSSFCILYFVFFFYAPSAELVFSSERRPHRHPYLKWRCSAANLGEKTTGGSSSTSSCGDLPYSQNGCFTSSKILLNT